MLSSEHSFEKTSRQYKWLEDDLKKVDRDVTPWVIVESHRPMYMSEYQVYNMKVQIAMRDEFEDLLVEHNVDLFLAGHFHSYLRTCSGLYRYKCNNGGPTHITVGTAGAKLDNGHLINRLWTESFMEQWGYGKITVYNSTVIHWSFISSDGEDVGETLDELWIKKEG